MSVLKYFSERAVETLYRSAGERLDWYYSPSDSAPIPRGVGHAIRDARQPAAPLRKILETGPASSSLDGRNALAVYRDTPLRQLRPRDAADERVWTYLCHVDCPSYVAGRWLRQRPRDDAIALSRVRNHFFAKGNRGIIRDNALSRLWWLGYIAHEVNPDDPAKFLRILLHRQDIRSALIERPTVSMNRRVLRAVYLVMEEYWDLPRSGRAHGAMEQSSPLFVREIFRDWMIRLNRRGGVVLLDALPDVTLADLVRREATVAVGKRRSDDG